MKDRIEHRYFFKHSLELIWEYLTQAELLTQWVMRNNFKPIPGYEFNFNTNPIPALEFDGIVHCRVLEIIPMKKISYTWVCGAGKDDIGIDSVVTWTLEEKNGGTEVLLEQQASRLSNTALFAGFENGWLKNLEKMDKKITETANDNTNA